MTLVREILFSCVLPSNSLVSVLTLEGLFELTRHLSRALDWPYALLLEMNINKNAVRFAAQRSLDTSRNNRRKP